MNSKVEAVVVILTAVSVVIIVFDIIFDPSGTVLTFIYAFDLGVVVILAIDFYFRAKESANKIFQESLNLALLLKNVAGVWD